MAETAREALAHAARDPAAETPGQRCAWARAYLDLWEVNLALIAAEGPLPRALAPRWGAGE